VILDGAVGRFHPSHQAALRSVMPRRSAAAAAADDDDDDEILNRDSIIHDVTRRRTNL